MILPSLLWVGPSHVHSFGWEICFWWRGNLSFLFRKLMNFPANCSNRPFQDIEFDPPSLDRKGHPIDYQPPCLVSRIGSTAPSLKKLMKTHAARTIVTYQSSKNKAVRGATQKAITGKRLRRTRPSAAQVNNPYSFQTDVQLLINLFSQLSTIASQSALGAGLLS